MARKIVPATARQVREFFAENSHMLPEGVTIGERGRLHPEVVDTFNRESGMRYDVGNRPTVTVPVPTKDAIGRNRTKMVSVDYQQARKLAGKHAGKRGYLSEVALSEAGKRLAKTLG